MITHLKKYIQPAGHVAVIIGLLDLLAASLSFPVSGSFFSHMVRFEDLLPRAIIQAIVTIIGLIILGVAVRHALKSKLLFDWVWVIIGLGTFVGLAIYLILAFQTPHTAAPPSSGCSSLSINGDTGSDTNCALREGAQ